MRRGIIILVIITCLGLSGFRQPALGQVTQKGGTPRYITLAYLSLLTTGLGLSAYYLWKNSPAERAKGYRENLGPGEWYLAAYLGLSYLPTQDWQFAQFFSPDLLGRTAQNVSYRPGFQGGIKFGRFFDTLPWFGMEMELSLCKNDIPGQNLRIAPMTAAGPNNLTFSPDRFLIWATQFNLLVRHGFLKDKEVPFGRLQPYLGIGPGFEVVYAANDSAKNFAIETQAGLRYMFTPDIAIFGEYKFSYQFAVEYQTFDVPGHRPVGTMFFDLPHHRFILGVSYHFKNLFGN
jgi:opacity protein-like surface antigen